MLKKKGFEILIASPPDHDHPVAEVYFDGGFVALVSEEEPAQFVVELPGSDMVEEMVNRRVPLEGFQDALKAAADCLREDTA